MRTRYAGRALALGLALGCASGGGGMETGGLPATQQFTREVRATAGAVVQAAVATFGDLGIPVARADEPGGEVRTVPVTLRNTTAYGKTDERIACPAADSLAAGADTAGIRVAFELKVKPVRDGSVVTLDARRENAASRCVVRAAFVSQVLNQIAAKASGR